MAYASARLEEVEVTKVEFEISQVTVTLDKDEAQFLADLMASIGGSPARSRRMYADSILDALRRVGLDAQDDIKDFGVDDGFRVSNNVIYVQESL